MALLNSVKNIITNFGNRVTLRRVVYTPSATKPWETTQTQTETMVRVVNPEYRLWVNKGLPADIIIAGDVVVSVNDTFVINSREYVVDTINEIDFKGTLVAKEIGFK